ncbi:hypothetical protein BUALT_Bualt12G0140300 [Buddleja alternifolia]|uniref:Proteinase inhibitor n=1 Tax=Buddleja alternifolia TaxID=168488 RepID=A0AAV6WSH0_9LAMI|nr:hypothetical protein BUALT_Bualt12G0140300 [Buddleja alternifolia]
MASCSGKKSWPELVGVNGQAAAAIIEQENKKVNATLVEEGSFLSGDFRCDRVRVFVDGNGIVTEVPRVG